MLKGEYKGKEVEDNNIRNEECLPKGRGVPREKERNDRHCKEQIFKKKPVTFVDVWHKDKILITFSLLQWFVRCVERAALSAPSFPDRNVSAAYPARVPFHPTPRGPPYWHVCRLELTTVCWLVLYCTSSCLFGRVVRVRDACRHFFRVGA